MEATVRRDRERDRGARSTASGSAVQPAWRTAREIEALGLPFAIVQDIELWCWERSLNTHVIDFRRGSSAAIVTMVGDCFFCRQGDGVNPRQHSKNHWVIMATPGFPTIRVRCHSSQRVQNLVAPFTEALLAYAQK